MSNYTIVGDGNIHFGTLEVGLEAVGQIVSASQTDTGDKLELKDRQGGVFMVVYFNAKNECELKAIWDTTFDKPVRGDAIDLFELEDLLVDEVRVDFANESEAQITIRATKYASGGMTLGA